MSESRLMQKQLSPAEVNQFTDPAQIVDAHGFGASGPSQAHVDVLPFAVARFDGSAGFETARPMVHRRFVDPAQCSAIFELEISAVWRGVPCRLIELTDVRVDETDRPLRTREREDP